MILVVDIPSVVRSVDTSYSFSLGFYRRGCCCILDSHRTQTGKLIYFLVSFVVVRCIRAPLMPAPPT